MCKLVSVLIPVYNVRPYIEESILSILSQSYCNLEVIIVDDCSSDGTYEFLKDKFLDDKRIKLYRNQVNKRIVETLNFALSESSGSYIARLDGDDIAHPERIERQVAYLDSHSDISLVGCSLEGVDGNGRHLSYSYFPEDYNLLKKLSYYSSPVSHIWLAKREVYEKLGGYRFASVEDYDFLLRMITEGYRFANISEFVGMKIRFREGNTVSTYGVEQRKAYNFVRNRYFERLKFGKEIKGEEDFLVKISDGKFSVLHQISNKFSKRAVSTNNILYKYSLYLFSAVLSPYQFQYLLHTLLRRIIIRLHK